MPSHVTLVARARVPRCAYCHDLIFRGDATWRCARCSTLQHLPCVREHGGCSVFSCATKIAQELEAEPPPETRREPVFPVRPPVSVPFSWWVLLEAPLVFLLRTWNVRHAVEAQDVALFVMVTGCTFACWCTYSGLLGMFRVG